MEPILELPECEGLIAVVSTDNSGEIVHAEGDDAEILGGVIAYLGEIASLLGGSFGLDEMEEAQLLGKNTTAVCVNRGDGYAGLLFEGKTKAKTIVPLVLEHLDP